MNRTLIGLILIVIALLVNGLTLVKDDPKPEAGRTFTAKYQ